MVRWGGAAGLLGACANLLFLFASGAGQLTITAVLAGLYPAVTVTLAAIVLHERINRSQQSGLLAAAASIVLIITGGYADTLSRNHPTDPRADVRRRGAPGRTEIR